MPWMCIVIKDKKDKAGASRDNASEATQAADA